MARLKVKFELVRIELSRGNKVFGFDVDSAYD